MASTLHLLIPGLLGPWPDRSNPAFPRPAAPALEWLLARATVAAAPATTDPTLFQLFGLSVTYPADLPVAAVTRLADGGDADDGWWWRADPVYFRPDLHGVFLADARMLAVEPAEARALAEAFNQTFASDGLQLDALRPDRWYLRLPADPGVRTHSLESAIGRDIRALLPYGPAKQRWHTLLTEAQMLFHNHPVNRAREDRNQPLISGLWPWGGGRCPAGARPPAAGLYAHDPLARGLARLANAAVAPLPATAADWREASASETDSLTLLDTTRFDPLDDDLEAWLGNIADLERDWFEPCRRLLQTGSLAALHLYPGNGRRYAVSKTARWRFWQRPRPLVGHL